MDAKRLQQLMHAVLDGEATSAEKRELEAVLAADPAAKAEFDALSGLFGQIAAVPRLHPPEGLYAAVMERLPAADQLSGAGRVIGSNPDAIAASGTTTGHRHDAPVATTREWQMSERQAKSSNRRVLWIGAGAAALVAVMVGSGILPPGDGTTSGTIVPAQRFRAEQPTTGDVKAQATEATRAPDASANGADARSVSLRGDQKAVDEAHTNKNSSDGIRANALVDGKQATDALRSGLSSDGKVDDARRSNLITDGRVVDGRQGSDRSSGLTSDARAMSGRAEDAAKADARLQNANSDGRVNSLVDSKSNAARVDGRQNSMMDGKVDAKAADGVRAP
ncbi:MAG: hypothetical protein U1F10_13105 [Burkholderiales bacterium]